MNILKSATDWGKGELFSTLFFILFGFVFIAGSLGFWKMGKTDLAKAYIIPALVAGALLLTIGLGLFFTNKSRIAAFKKAYNSDASGFVLSELERTESTLKEYNTIVFTAIPLILTACALLLLFAQTPIWRASLITSVAMLVVILLIDGIAQARIDDYRHQLIQAAQEYKK